MCSLQKQADLLVKKLTDLQNNESAIHDIRNIIGKPLIDIQVKEESYGTTGINEGSFDDIDYIIMNYQFIYNNTNFKYTYFVNNSNGILRVSNKTGNILLTNVDDLFHNIVYNDLSDEHDSITEYVINDINEWYNEYDEYYD